MVNKTNHKNAAQKSSFPIWQPRYKVLTTLWSEKCHIDFLSSKKIFDELPGDFRPTSSLGKIFALDKNYFDPFAVICNLFYSFDHIFYQARSETLQNELHLDEIQHRLRAILAHIFSSKNRKTLFKNIDRVYVTDLSVIAQKLWLNLIFFVI